MNYDLFKAAYIKEQQEKFQAVQKTPTGADAKQATQDAKDEIKETEELKKAKPVAEANEMGTTSSKSAPVPALSKAPGNPKEVNRAAAVAKLKGASGSERKVDVAGPNAGGSNKGPVISDGKKLNEQILSKRAKRLTENPVFAEVQEAYQDLVDAFPELSPEELKDGFDAFIASIKPGEQVAV